MPRYKLQVQEDDAQPDEWRDVRDEHGLPLVYADQETARAALAARYPVLTKLEQFQADRKRTRVIVIDPYADLDEERDE